MEHTDLLQESPRALIHPRNAKKGKFNKKNINLLLEKFYFLLKFIANILWFTTTMLVTFHKMVLNFPSKK